MPLGSSPISPLSWAPTGLKYLNKLTANPSLALLGFYIYKANGSFKNGIRDNIVIISREKFIIGQKVSYIKLDDRIYYAKGVN